MKLRHITEFYELPLDRVTEFHRMVASEGFWLRRRRRAKILASLRQPIPPLVEPEPYLAAVLGYIDEREILETEPLEYEQLLTDLVEIHGGGWDLLAAGPGAAASLDPTRFDEADLGRFWKQDGDDDAAGSGPEMSRALHILRQALDQTSDGSLLLIAER